MISRPPFGPRWRLRGGSDERPNPISWHRKRLANGKATLACYRAEADRAKDQVDRLATEISAYEAQIINAEAEGLAEFDPERFGKRRRKAR